jgi:hypothetical protein
VTSEAEPGALACRIGAILVTHEEVGKPWSRSYLEIPPPGGDGGSLSSIKAQSLPPLNRAALHP